MTYYPKNKIKTNLFTNGNEYQTYSMTIMNSSPTYTGYYYSLANGKYYTGKFPGDGTNDELFPLIQKPTPTTPIPKTLTPPLYPTPDDYNIGYFTRYFSKKRNEFVFEELTKEKFNLVYTNLYIPFSITWYITGPNIDRIFITNKNASLLAEQQYKVPGFVGFLQDDFARYYK